MKNLRWFSIVPFLLICFSTYLAIINWFSLEEKDMQEFLDGKYIREMDAIMSFFYVLANAFIAYTVYVYQENKGLVYVHIAYLVVILLTFNDQMSTQEPDYTSYFLTEIMVFVLDILAVVYSMRIQNPPLAFWFKVFTIAVLTDKILGIILSLVLEPEVNYWISLTGNFVVDISLMLLFWKLAEIPLNWKHYEKPDPEDLLDRREFE